MNDMIIPIDFYAYVVVAAFFCFVVSVVYYVRKGTKYSVKLFFFFLAVFLISVVEFNCQLGKKEETIGLPFNSKIKCYAKVKK